MPKFSAYMKGGDGPVGPPGASFISGIVATTTELPPSPPENRRIYLVGDSDPKHIYAYVDGEWVDQGLTASEVVRADASISSISWTQDPSVQVSFSTENQKDYFHFKFNIPDERAAINSLTTDVKSISTDLNSNYVKKASDTMTGVLTIAPNSGTVAEFIKHHSMDISVTQASTNVLYNSLYFYDKNNKSIGYVQTTQTNSGRSAISINARNYRDSANVNNYLTLIVNDDKSLDVNIPDNAGLRTSWRDKIQALSKEGADTTLGTISVKNSTLSYTTAPTSDRFDNIIEGKDKYDNLYGSFRFIHYKNSNSLGTSIFARRVVDGTVKYNDLELLITTTGVPSVYVTNPGEWRKGIGAVNIAGDTMMGNLSITKSAPALYLKNTSMDNTAQSSDSALYSYLTFTDQNNKIMSMIRAMESTAGTSVLNMIVRHDVSGSDVDNTVSIRVSKDGTKSVLFSDPAAWRTALEEILYYTSQTVSVASNAQIMRIPSSGTDSKITTDTIVLECTFNNSNYIRSSVSWTSYDGYITFTGTCATATTANVTLGNKGN